MIAYAAGTIMLRSLFYLVIARREGFPDVAIPCLLRRSPRSLAPHCVPWHRPPHRPGVLPGGQVWCSAGVSRDDRDEKFASPADSMFLC